MFGSHPGQLTARRVARLDTLGATDIPTDQRVMDGEGAHPPADPGRVRRHSVADGRAHGSTAVLPFVLAAGSVLCWKLSLGSIHPYRAGVLGLITQLSPLWWTALVLAAAALFSELRHDSPRLTGMVTGLVALAIVLHGTLPAAEPVPRFSTAYYIAGFSDYIARTGHTLPRVDVRMSWPAMFAAAGMAARAMGVSTLWFLRWCPLVLNLAYLIPLKAIANSCLRTPRARWARARHLFGERLDRPGLLLAAGPQPPAVPRRGRHRDPGVLHRWISATIAGRTGEVHALDASETCHAPGVPPSFRRHPRRATGHKLDSPPYRDVRRAVGPARGIGRLPPDHPGRALSGLLRADAHRAHWPADAVGAHGCPGLGVALLARPHLLVESPCQGVRCRGAGRFHTQIRPSALA